MAISRSGGVSGDTGREWERGGLGAGRGWRETEVKWDNSLLLGCLWGRGPTMRDSGRTGGRRTRRGTVYGVSGPGVNSTALRR